MLKFLLLCGYLFLGLSIFLLTFVENAVAQSIADLEDNQINYTESDGRVLLTEEITVSGSSITSASIRFESGYEANEDTLLYNGEDHIYPIFDEDEGALYLLSYPAGTTRSSAEMQAALRSVYYLNTDDRSPRVRGRRLSFEVISRNGTSNSLSRDIKIRGENDAPVLRSPSNTPVVVNSLIRAVPIVEDLRVYDPDDNTLVGATVDITQSRFGDQLVFEDDGDDNIQIQLVEGSGNRSLVLSGQDSKENYQAALRSVSISNLFTAQGFKGNRLIIMEVTDEDGAASAPFSQYIHVANGDNAVNVPPSIKDFDVSTEEETPISFTQQQFRDVYEDAEDSEFTFIRLLSLPSHGILTLDGSIIDADYIVNDNGVVDAVDLNKLKYTPNAEFGGDDMFEWNATDGSDFAANPAYVEISVRPPDIPLSIAVPDNAQVDEDGVTTLPPLVLSASSSRSLDVQLSVESGQLFVDSLLTSLIDFSDEVESGRELEFTSSAQVVGYVLSGLKYQPDQNVAGSDLLDISVASSSEQEERVLSITIIPIDDPIVLSDIESDSVIYLENSEPVTITDQLALSDPDGAATVVSATVTVSDTLDQSQEVLTYTLEGGISAQLQDSQLLFTGEGSLSQYQSVLRSVAYQNTSENPAVAFRTFTFAATDENDSTSNAVSRVLQVIAVDDSTLLSTSETGPLNYVLGSDPVALHPTLTVTDVDSDSLSRLVVAFDEGYDPALDTLLFVAPEGMDASWDEETGALTVDGMNSLEAYQAIIRSVRYYHSAVAASSDRQLSAQVFNGDTPSNILVRAVQLIENEPPVLTDFEKKVVQNSLLTFTLEDFLSHYSDPDQFPAPDQFSSLRVVTLPEHGALLLDGDTITQGEIDEAEGGFFVSTENISQLRYAPEADYTGTDQFGWNAFDGAELAVDTATVSITVVPALSVSPPSSTEICPGEAAELSVEVLSGEEPFTYSWTCDQEDCRITTASDNSTISVSPQETTNYIFRVESNEGLDSIQDTVTVSVLDCSDVLLEIPSAFTPNQDNVNDLWEFPNASIFSSIRVEVYDRFGQTVYESTLYQNDWDGTYEGKKLPTATYYYRVVVNQGLQEHKGTVTLLR